jgi:zinc D-Ala-D-Ala carboxypeptidase
MRLTKNFTLEELTFSETASRKDIDNTIPEEYMSNVQKLAEGLQDVRNLLDKPILISSGYRCLELNTLLGSKPTSAHTRALAADFISPGYGSVEEVMEAIVNSDIQYDQCILEFDRWIHLAFSDEGYEPRRNNLVIDKSGVRLY